jgi:predicted dinucleotide-binding enzyme
METRVWKHNGISAGEAFAAGLPQSTKVYKAFNTIGAEHMERAAEFLPGQRLTMLFAGGAHGSGDNKVHREVVEDVIAGVGFEPAYVGPIHYARNLEALAELWIHLSMESGAGGENWGRNFHFQVVRK